MYALGGASGSGSGAPAAGAAGAAVAVALVPGPPGLSWSWSVDAAASEWTLMLECARLVAMVVLQLAVLAVHLHLHAMLGLVLGHLPSKDCARSAEELNWSWPNSANLAREAYTTACGDHSFCILLCQGSWFVCNEKQSHSSLAPVPDSSSVSSAESPRPLFTDERRSEAGASAAACS